MQHYLERLEWSWHHHYTLPLLAAGIACFTIAVISYVRSWNGILTALMGVGATLCLSGALVVALLNGFTRGQDTFEHDMAHEVRKVH